LSEATHILRKYWNYENFRSPQEEIIESVVEGKDTFALLPTGAGKSICFQVPAMMSEGICLVISPLIALIQDQVESLKNKNIKATSLAGQLKQEEISDILDNCLYGNYKFLYLSPERLKQEWIFERILSLPIHLIAIDEAHCISQWGHDFRPAYLEINKLKDYFFNTPFIALTASANKRVQEDIIQQLKLNNPAVFKKSFERKEIVYSVYIADDTENLMHRIVQKHPESAIIYVRNRRKTFQVAQNLISYGIQADFFHGVLNFKEKKEKLQRWLNNENQVMVATNAFGMGIDKPDVKNVIHIQIPENIDSYYQEAGRAGRNGSRSFATILLKSQDIEKAKELFYNSLLDKTFLLKVYKNFVNYHQIAYGEGYAEVFHFNFNDFCLKYQLPQNKTFQAFQFLDRQAIIHLQTEFSYISTIHFLISNEAILDYFKNEPRESRIFLNIIHHYKGTDEIETKIDLQKIAASENISPDKLLEIIYKWQNKGFCTFNNSNSDTTVQFNEIREDAITINRSISYLKQQNQIKTQQFEAMLNYITDTETCKNQLILKYFDEFVSETCGQCSTCRNKLQQKEISKNPLIIKNKILYLTQSKPLDLEELAQQLSLESAFLIGFIRELLEEDKLEVQHHKYIARQIQ